MSELKFACPVCGQHITCDAAKSGAQLVCPTCFQKLIVPASQSGGGSKLLLTAVQAQSRPVPQSTITDASTTPAPPRQGKWVMVAVAAIVLPCAVIAVFALRDTLFKRSPGDNSSNGSSSPMVTDAGWKSDLAGVAIPVTPAAGRINGHVFNPTRVTLQGGLLTLRQVQKGSQELAITISLSANAGGELAGRDIEIDSKRDPAPAVGFRWKDRAKQPIQKSTPPGYLLRLQFGLLAGDRLPGKIYFCASDGAKSWVAGHFEAEISAPLPAKSRPPSAPKPKR